MHPRRLPDGWRRPSTSRVRTGYETRAVKPRRTSSVPRRRRRVGPGDRILRGYTGAAPPCEMLVLALQFSRCDLNACGVSTPRGASSTQRRHRSRRTIRLLQNGREDKCAVTAGVGGKPATTSDATDVPTSAPTGMSRHRVVRSTTDDVEWTP